MDVTVKVRVPVRVRVTFRVRVRVRVTIRARVRVRIPNSTVSHLIRRVPHVAHAHVLHIRYTHGARTCPHMPAHAHVHIRYRYVYSTHYARAHVHGVHAYHKLHVLHILHITRTTYCPCPCVTYTLHIRYIYVTYTLHMEYTRTTYSPCSDSTVMTCDKYMGYRSKDRDEIYHVVVDDLR